MMNKFALKIENIKKLIHASPEMAMPGIAAIVIILIMIVTLTQGMINIKQMIKKEGSNIKTVTKSTDSSYRLILDIPQWHLFGAAPITLDTLAQTRLQLTLNGVMTNIDKQNAYAIIGAPGKDQKLYRLQDALPGGATLYQIGPQGIIIQYNGELQQLPLLKPAK